MKIKSTRAATRILWLSDTHLDVASERRKARFFEKLDEMSYDVVVITGDISSARDLGDHLRNIAESCSPRPVFFVLGNHDFYASSIARVEKEVDSICRSQRNLHHLGNGEIVRVNGNTAIVGHRGWADGRAGFGKRTIIESRDHHSIHELQDLSNEALFERMEQYGRESAAYFRRVLPHALSCFPNVIVATHVPPFTWAAQFNGKECGWTHLPHYCNQSAGSAILGIARKHPLRKITVMCGHTHSSTRIRILDNLEVRVAGAQRGRPAIQGIIELN